MLNQSSRLIKNNSVLLAILISLISFLAYMNTLQHQFVFDDFRIIVNNPFIKDWKYFPALFNSDYFKISGELSYRPLVTLSYFIDYAIWGLNAFGFHLTNLLIHTLNTFIVYLLLFKITRRFNLTVISCLFFSIHPHTYGDRQFCGISGRPAVRYLFLLTVFFYVKLYTSKYKKPCCVASLLAYFFSLLSKEMAISLPLIIFVLDWFLPQSRVRISHPPPNPPHQGGGIQATCQFLFINRTCCTPSPPLVGGG